MFVFNRIIDRITKLCLCWKCLRQNDYFWTGTKIPKATAYFQDLLSKKDQETFDSSCYNPFKFLQCINITIYVYSFFTATSGASKLSTVCRKLKTTTCSTSELTRARLAYMWCTIARSVIYDHFNMGHLVSAHFYLLISHPHCQMTMKSSQLISWCYDNSLVTADCCCIPVSVGLPADRSVWH